MKRSTRSHKNSGKAAWVVVLGLAGAGAALAAVSNAVSPWWDTSLQQLAQAATGTEPAPGNEPAPGSTGEAAATPCKTASEPGSEATSCEEDGKQTAGTSDEDLVVPPAGLAVSPTPVSGTLGSGTGLSFNSGPINSVGPNSTTGSSGTTVRALSASLPPIPGGGSGTASLASVPNNCPSADLAPVSNASSYLTGRRMCASRGSERWQEFHSGTGELIDWKLGPGHPRDPRTTVGTWSANGNVLTHVYGAQSYSFNVCADSTNATRVNQGQSSTLLLVGISNASGVQLQATIEQGEGACS